MVSFTLDTNCLLAVDEKRPAAPAVLALADAHQIGRASVALVAISASERQRAGGHLESFEEFKRRVAALGLGHLELVPPMLYFDVTFWDYSLWHDDAMQKQEEDIHKVLFPGIPFLWSDYCAANGLDIHSAGSQGKNWRNAKCDVQALWSHLHARRDVFVTSDKNFHLHSKKPQLLSLFNARVETPQSAAAMLP
jgi:hypothetical protein